MAPSRCSRPPRAPMCPRSRRGQPGVGPAVQVLDLHPQPVPAVQPVHVRRGDEDRLAAFTRTGRRVGAVQAHRGTFDPPVPAGTAVHWVRETRACGDVDGDDLRDGPPLEHHPAHAAAYLNGQPVVRAGLLLGGQGGAEGLVAVRVHLCCCALTHVVERGGFLPRRIVEPIGIVSKSIPVGQPVRASPGTTYGVSGPVIP